MQCRLIESCIPRDLLEYGGALETVRFVSYQKNAVRFTFEPCFCASCTVGHTRHGTNRPGAAPAEDFYFPQYRYLNKWDRHCPVTRLFTLRAGTIVTVMVPMDIVYGPNNLKWHR